MNPPAPSTSPTITIPLPIQNHLMSPVMTLPGMKKHVRVLEEAELMRTERIGRVRRCTLAPAAFEGITTWLQRLDRFAQVVERTRGDR